MLFPYKTHRYSKPSQRWLTVVCQRTTTLQELNDLLNVYDMKRDLVKVNYKASQWTHGAVWNRRYMEPKRGHRMSQLWQDRETNTASKTTNLSDVTADDIRQVARVAAAEATSTLAESRFIRALGTPEVVQAPPQTATLARRATEEWERSICENKAFAILHKTQEGKPALIKQDGGKMLVALVLDKPLAAVKALISRQSSGTCYCNHADSERETASPRHSPDGKTGRARRPTCFTICSGCVIHQF